MDSRISIYVKELIHYDDKRYFLFFPRNDTLQDELRRIAAARYSNTHKAWHIAAQKVLLQKIKEELGARVELDLTALLLRTERLPDYVELEAKHATVNTGGTETQPLRKPQGVSNKTLPSLDPTHIPKIEIFKKWMQSRRYSKNTISTYTDGLQLFLRFNAGKRLEEINNSDLLNFDSEYIVAQQRSASFQNQVINAVKLFFAQIEYRKLEIERIYRPKREKLLPNVLSKEEVKAILSALNNIKHKTMLSLIYACGLRCGELLNLRPEHIVSGRKIVLIKQAKGRKDRIVPLSDKILDLLRDYWKVQQPKHYVFEGQVKGEPYDARSLQQVLKQALAKTTINKPVTLHWLRHSYATHLLENGTDLRYIQEILGHSSSRTTEIYTHVSNQSIQRITSPFDYL